MTYSPNIPQATDVPSQSQGQLLTNFTALNTVFAVDHLAFNAVDGGEHQQVTFNSVIADPNLAAPKCSLYIKTVAGSSQLFFENVMAAVNVQRQITNLTITTVGTNNGVRTAAGLVFNWGTGVCVGGILTVTFAVPFTAGTVPVPIVSALANAAGNNNAVVDITTPPTNTQFRARTTQAAGQFLYHAIGV